MTILFISFVSYRQSAKSDTSLNKINSVKTKPTDKDFLQVSKGAEAYINSLLGDSFYNEHVKINFKQTTKDHFQVVTGDAFNSNILETHFYYNINYYLIDKKDTLSYFELLVDSLGKPTTYDKVFYFSSPTKFLLSFQELFDKKFKIDFAEAIAIGKQHGFQTKPFLDYQSLDEEKIFWRFYKKLADGKRKFTDINA